MLKAALGGDRDGRVCYSKTINIMAKVRDVYVRL